MIGLKSPAKGRRGIALIMVIILIAVIAILIGAVMQTLIQEVRSAGVNGVSNQALNAAYTGIDDITLALEEGTSGKNIKVPTPISTALPGDGWFASSYTAKVDYQFPTTKGLAYFLISATGTAGGPVGATFGGAAPKRTLHALLRTVPYSAYEYYSVSEVNNVGGKVWYTNGQQFDGPVYSGGPMNIMYTDGAKDSIFGSTVETGQPINWLNFANGKSQGPQTAADWLAVLTGGQNASGNLTTGVLPKPLPTYKDNLLVASEAFSGADTGLKQPPQIPAGLYINGQLPTSSTGGALASGIYISGDVTVWAEGSGTSGNGQQKFVFQTTTGRYDITIDFNTNQTLVSGPGGSTTYTGVPSGQPGGSSGGNGSIFVDGNVTVAGGINADGSPNSTIDATTHGQFTLAVPDYGSSGNLSYINTITLNRSMKYTDNPRLHNPPTSTDVLALWANNIRVNDNSDMLFEVDALLLTGYDGECTGTCHDGTFSNLSCGANACRGGANRELLIFGSLIENVRGKLGTQVTGADHCSTGFCRHMGYDARLGSNPPPFSPTTNKYEITAITETSY